MCSVKVPWNGNNIPILQMGKLNYGNINALAVYFYTNVRDAKQCCAELCNTYRLSSWNKCCYANAVMLFQIWEQAVVEQT